MTKPPLRAVPPAAPDWTTTSLGERVEHVCALRGWSLNKLGEEAGIASGVMSRLARREAHVAGAPDTLARLADAAHVSVVWLMLGRGPVETPAEAKPAAPVHAPRTLRHHPEWPRVLAEAQSRQRGMADELWDLAGDTVLPSSTHLDWQLVVGIIRELHAAEQRWLAESAGRTEPPAAAPPASTRARPAVRKK